MKILIAVDASKSAGKVVDFTSKLAKKLDAEATLFHVVTVPTGVPVGVDPTAFVRAGEKLLNELKIQTEKVGVRTSIHVDSAYGNPSSRIISYAKKEGFDLIALGAMGESEIKDLFLGSVAHTVSRHANCPVLIVR
jgi:nucleotide-binding universal stress UspA family protein